MLRNLLFVLLLGLCVMAGLPVSAQTATPTPPPAPCTATFTIDRSEPVAIDNAVPSNLSLTGTGFTATTTVRLLGYGYLTPTFLNTRSLTATLPAGIPTGVYRVEIADSGALCYSPQTLTVSQYVTPFPLPTLALPTALVGQPNLLVRNFTVNPATVTPGTTVSASVEVINGGNLPAFGISISVDSGGKFAPTAGAAVTVPDLFPGNSSYVTLSMIVAADAPNGANFIPLTLTFRDSDGKPYTSKASLSAVVEAGSALPLITVLTYSVTPEIIVPGQIAVITAQIQNTGDKTASQVLIRLAGTTPILIAGPRGDSFPVGDITPGSTRIVDIPLYVAQDAKAGVQSQPFTLSYVLDGKATETPTSLAINVAAISRPQPIILLDSATLSSSEIKPGDTFTLSFTLKNVGTAEAGNMLVSFGTVETSGGDSGVGTPTGNSTTTRPSSQFAPLGTGATQFVGVLAEEGEVALTQDFIASATLDSGIYGLPITARYVRDDGTSASDSFSATVVVVGLPKLQVTFDSPLPTSTDQFSAVPLAVTITNRGKNPLMIDRIEVTGDGIDVLDGGSTPVGQLKTDEQTSISATVSPSVEGTFSVTFNVYYLDDLNRPQVFPLTYESESIALPPLPDYTEEPPMEIIETPTPLPPQEDIISKLLLGFLGLGGD